MQAFLAYDVILLGEKQKGSWPLSKLLRKVPCKVVIEYNEFLIVFATYMQLEKDTGGYFG